MKYYFTKTCIRDGEYEYQSPKIAQAEDIKQAQDELIADDKEWVKDDYRIAEFGTSVEEISKEDFEVLKKYL